MTKEQLKQEIFENIPKNSIIDTILLDIIAAVIEHFIEKCIKNRRIDNFSKLNRFQSLFLRKKINEEVRKNNLDKDYKSKIYQAFLKVGSNYNRDKIYEALNN